MYSKELFVTNNLSMLRRNTVSAVEWLTVLRSLSAALLLYCGDDFCCFFQYSTEKGEKKKRSTDEEVQI